MSEIEQSTETPWTHHKPQYGPVHYVGNDASERPDGAWTMVLRCTEPDCDLGCTQATEAEINSSPVYAFKTTPATWSC